MPLSGAPASVGETFHQTCHLRLVWSAQLHPVGEHSPWDRLRDRLLWDTFIKWLREDVHLEEEMEEMLVQSADTRSIGSARTTKTRNRVDKTRNPVVAHPDPDRFASHGALRSPGRNHFQRYTALTRDELMEMKSSLQDFLQLAL